MMVSVEGAEQGRGALTDLLSRPASLGAVADGAIAGGFVAHAALSIDPHVLNAIEFSTADHLHNLPGIDSYVHDHFFAVPVQSADGWFERLTGYVAEQKAAAYFEQLGHHVDFAPVANQPVWDMLVDGHPVQIKEGLAGAKDFVANHPAIDVYTSPEVAAAMKDPAVHGLDVLNKDAIHAATQNGIDHIHHVVSPEFHLPFITLAFSSWREAKLLWNEKTTFERAFVNVGLDVVGVGGGALAGSKAGAVAGGFIGGPIGAAIGGFFGAIFGGVGGKLLATGIRHAPFHAARDAYNAVVATAQSSVNGEIEWSKRRVGELRDEYQRMYEDDRTRIEGTARDQIRALNHLLQSDLQIFCESFPQLLDDLLRQLDEEERDVLDQIPSSGFWGMLCPSENDFHRAIVRAWFKRARKLVRQESVRYSAIETRSVEALHGEIQRFLREYEFELQSLSDALERLQQAHASAKRQAEAIREGAIKQVESTRNGLIAEFGKHVGVAQAKIVDEIKKWNGVIAQSRSELKKKAAAVGVDL